MTTHLFFLQNESGDTLSGCRAANSRDAFLTLMKRPHPKMDEIVISQALCYSLEGLIRTFPMEFSARFVVGAVKGRRAAGAQALIYNPRHSMHHNACPTALVRDLYMKTEISK